MVYTSYIFCQDNSKNRVLYIAACFAQVSSENKGLCWHMSQSFSESSILLWCVWTACKWHHPLLLHILNEILWWTVWEWPRSCWCILGLLTSLEKPWCLGGHKPPRDNSYMMSSHCYIWNDAMFNLLSDAEVDFYVKLKTTFQSNGKSESCEGIEKQRIWLLELDLYICVSQ